MGFESPGSCSDGECSYGAFVEQDCANDGLICRVDRCVPDPCAGVSCNRPPADVCDGDVAYTFTGTATCNDGRCAYERVADDCAAYPGGYCFNGACESSDPCFGVTCGPPPPPTCDGDNLITSSGAGTCSGGRCSYSQATEDCAAVLGGYCFDGACASTDLCFGVTCTTPPAAVCDGDTATTFSLPGACSSGECRYARRNTDCAAQGKFCYQGTCRTEDPCLLVDCSTPPPAGCSGNTRVVYSLPGACQPGGQCDYVATETDCTATDEFCVDGACVEADPCDAVNCDTPPTSYCDTEVAIRFENPGDCALGDCSYARITEDCGAYPQGYCFNGACQSFDPCFGQVCETPGLPVCDGDTAVAFANPGVCVDGDCEYIESRDNCLAYDGGYCFGGICASTDPCFRVTCAEPPAPSCDGDRVITYALPGACDDGRCQYTQAATDCALTGQFCYRGACTDFDPCLFTTCDTPPAAECDGNTLVEWASTGTCAAGVCSYDAVVTDCRATGDFCFEGACQATDPCSGVDCTLPPAALCNGDVAEFYQPVGVCAAGECDYTMIRQNCADIPGGYCFNGVCDSTDACFGVDCAEPPAPVCDRDTVVTYLADGDCVGGQCVFEESRLACGEVTSNGFCVDGACQSTDPCFRVTCDSVPPPVCDGNAAVSFVAPGECLGGQCVFDPAPTDCTALGQVCSNGRCVPPDPCNGVLCNTPPAPYCDGNRIVVSVSPGACTSGNCGYSQQFIDCSATDSYCVAGACQPVDPCVGVSCSTPPARDCRGTVAVEYRRPGQCIEGDCAFTELRSDCAIYPGGTCVDGACELVDPCDGITCAAPPAAFCDGTVVVTSSNPGTCGNGRCSYVQTRSDCAASASFCFNGACVPNDPCTGVTCQTPPLTDCSGEIAVSFASPGICQGGTCFYSQTQTNCADRGERCDNGACIAEPGCSGVICQTPPAATCNGEVATRYVVPGECRTGACRYSSVEEDCAAQDKFCSAGFCQATDPCLGASCNQPPSLSCRGNVAVSVVSTGECAQGACLFDESTVDCSLTGRYCVSGACRTNDPCTGVACDEPAEPACDGTVAITYTLPGTCSLGNCTYTALRDDCAADDPNGICFDGACSSGDPCEGRTCNTPPTGTCDENVAIGYVAPGICSIGTCQYTEARTDCTASGRFCFSGRCQVTNPCQGVLCNAPPEPTCSGDVRISYEDRGICSSGLCQYNEVQTDCTETGEVCFLGECIRDTACDGPTCTSPPPAVCDGNIARGYTSPGACLLGNCSYTATAEDCSATGEFCYHGACQATDPCAGIACALTPAPACEDGIAVTYTGANSCREGLCYYGTTREDCAASGRFCVLGSCELEDPCAGLTCDDPPFDTCVGNTARAYSPAGVCDLGTCDYAATDTNCTALGQECFDGACGTVDPCVGIVCETLPPPVCDGTIAESYLLPGACYGGECVFGTRRIDCDFDGGVCRNGVCVSSPIPLAGDLVVTEFMADPVGADAGFEWFEIRNRSARRLDLGGIRVRDTGAIPQSFVIPAGIELASGAELVLGQSATAVTGGVDVNWGGAAVFSLDNTADAIVLELGAVELDRIEYGAGWPLVVARSAQLDSLSIKQSNDEAARWCVGTALYDPLNSGTPGAENFVCSVPASDIVAGELVIAEIMNNPNDLADAQAEWIELVNTTSRSLSIAGLSLDTSGSEAFVFGAGTTILPGQSLVVAASALALDQTEDYLWADGFTIADASDIITLSSTLREIDRVAFTAATWPVVAGRSISLDFSAYTLDNANPLMWCAGLRAYNSGGTDAGTPATTNSRCPAFSECAQSSNCAVPSTYCEGSVDVSFSGTGTCTGGVCDYTAVRTRVDCSADGDVCVAGSCVTP
jgi:hypothetical protein